jgi:hypothetical protein
VELTVVFDNFVWNSFFRVHHHRECVQLSSNTASQRSKVRNHKLFCPITCWLKQSRFQRSDCESKNQWSYIIFRSKTELRFSNFQKYSGCVPTNPNVKEIHDVIIITWHWLLRSLL